MAKDYTCWDCGYYGGRHEARCPRKGYPMPSSPKDEPPATERMRADCPCGIHRDDCDYHRPAPPKPYEYGAYDAATGLTVELTGGITSNQAQQLRLIKARVVDDTSAGRVSLPVMFTLFDVDSTIVHGRIK